MFFDRRSRCSLLCLMLIAMGVFLLGCRATQSPASQGFRQAAIAWIQENPEVAESLYATAAEAGNDPIAEAVALAAKGDFLLRHDQTEAAHEAYQQGLNLDGNSPAIHAGMGDAALVAGDTSKAELHYQTALKHDPRYAPALGGLGLIALQAENWEEAATRFAAATDPAATAFDPSVIEGYGRLAQATPKVQPVFQTWLEGHLKAHPEDIRAFVIAGDYFRRSNSDERALEVWSWAHHQRPEYPGLADKLGQLHLDQGHFVDAVKLFEAAYAARPTEERLEMLAVGYANLPDLDNALALYERGIREYPDSLAFPVGKGQVLYLQGAYDEAYRTLEPFTTGGAAPYQVYRELGLIEIARGNFTAARQWLEFAHDQHPFEPWVNFQLAYLAARNGDRDTFERHMPRVFEAGFMTNESLATFDNYAALIAIDWAATWIDARTLVSRGEGR